MILLWTLSSLVLSYTLGFPMLNNTSSGSYMKTFPNVTERNFTVEIKTDWTSHQLSMDLIPKAILPELQTDLPNLQMAPAPGCSLGICAVQILAHRMQIGDEKAGDSASDAWGPGKK